MDIISDEFIANVSDSINKLVDNEYCDLLIMQDVYNRLAEFNEVLRIACSQRNVKEDLSPYHVLKCDEALLSTKIMMNLISLLEKTNNELLKILKHNSEIQAIDVFKFTKEKNIEEGTLIELLYENNRLGIRCFVNKLEIPEELLYYDLDKSSFTPANSYQLFVALSEANKELRNLLGIKEVSEEEPKLVHVEDVTDIEENIKETMAEIADEAIEETKQEDTSYLDI